MIYKDIGFFGFFKMLALRIMPILQGADLAEEEIQLAILILLSILCAFLGSFLVLRKVTMVANALSHTALLGIVCTALLIGSTPSFYSLFLSAFFTCLLTSFTIRFFTEKMGVQADASIGLVFTAFFALAILLVSVYLPNSHMALESVMGSIDLLQIEDLKAVFYLTLFNIILTILFFKEYKLLSFSESYAHLLRLPKKGIDFLFFFQIALVTMSAFRAVGVLLVLALLVGPALLGRRMSKGLSGMVFWGAFFSVIISLISVALSLHSYAIWHISLSTGGIFTSLLFFAYLSLIFIQWRFRVKRC